MLVLSQVCSVSSAFAIISSDELTSSCAPKYFVYVYFSYSSSRLQSVASSRARTRLLIVLNTFVISSRSSLIVASKASCLDRTMSSSEHIRATSSLNFSMLWTKSYLTFLMSSSSILTTSQEACFSSLHWRQHTASPPCFQCVLQKRSRGYLGWSWHFSVKKFPEDTFWRLSTWSPRRSLCIFSQSLQ